jgi:TonB family protein
LSALLTVGCAEDNGKFKMATEIVAKEDGDEKKFDSYDPSDSVWFQEVTILGEIVAVDSLGYDSKPPTDVRIFAEVMPEFHGGMHALMKYISENVEYPKGETVPGTVFVEFVVNTDGSLSDIKIIKSSDSQAFDKEVIKMIEGMPPWKPGMEGGVNVRVKYVVPVRVTWG